MTEPSPSDTILPLVFDRVGLRVGGVLLLDDISLCLRSGTRSVILGPNGSLCALAHLVSRSGNEALVNELAKKENYFCVGKDRNSAVEKWIRTSGLTLEECIQIQEPGMIMENPPKPEKRG